MPPQSRPVPMNATPHHSKVKVSLTLSDPIFVAGANVSGKMEVECRGDGEFGLGIGLIMIELFAIQELTSPDHSATSTFIHSRRLFQGPGLPPSNAIQSDSVPSSSESPLPAYHYPARRGLTTFFFRFRTPPSSPASISFGPAQIRYEVRASVSVAWRGEKRLVTDQREINVVECCGSQALREHLQGVTIADGGNIWAQASITNGPIIAGDIACVELLLKNHSLKWTSGVTLTLSRELRLSSPSADKVLNITDTVTEVEFKGHEYMVPPGVEGIAILVINVPRSSCGSRGGVRIGENGKMTDGLFDVCCSLRLRVDMPVGSEPVIIIIPLVIHHPLAVPERPITPYAFPATPSPQPYASPPMHAHLFTPPPVASYVVNPHFSQHHGPPRAYWPPPSLPMDYSPPTLALPEQYYPPEGLFSPNLHLQHYTPPPRPASAEPHPQMPYYDPNLVSGLPTSVTHPPLPQPPISYHSPRALENSPQHNADSEEGKGLRASRISQTLHLSSRHRSVSPLSHRYPLPQPSGQHVSPCCAHPGPIQIPSLPNPYDSQDVLHSPRPIPSPKQSYLGPSPRSENVCTLERMADEVGRQSGNLNADLPGCVASMASSVDKTPSSLPAPSGTRPFQVRPHIEAVFTDATDAELSALKPELEPAAPHPPTPPLAAITPIKFPRAPTALSGLGANLGRDIPQENGLDALERRLLAEVGTRRQDTEGLRADVRSVVQPITIPPSGAPAGVNDSAISSLTLADRDGFLRGDEAEREQEQQPEQDQDRDSDERTQHRGRHSQSDDEREVRTQRGRGWTKSKHSDEDDERRAARKRERERKKGKNDIRKLRSETKGRIAAWLGEIDTASPPLMDDSLSTLSPAASHFMPITENEPFAPTTSAEDPLPSLGDRERGSTLVNDDVSAAPNPRSSGFVTISTLKAAGAQPPAVPPPIDLDTARKVPTTRSPAPGPILRKMSAGQSPVEGPIAPLPSAPPARSKSPGITVTDTISSSPRHVLSPRSARHASQPLIPDVKYDIRSARGGRGGRVMEVASLWAAKADGTATQAKPSRVVPPVKKPVNYGGRLPIKSPLSSPQTNGPADTTKEGRGKATNATKAMTVPAIISSSHAVPMLSSTASLARSPPNPRSPTSLPLPPMISETISNGNHVKATIPKTTRPPSDLGFGQARLRDLIKKYQG